MVKIKKSQGFQKRPCSLKIQVFNKQKAVSISIPSVKRLVACVLEDFKVSSEEVIVHFVNKKKICALHSQFFDDASPTDCISFPIDPPSKKGILGEVFICPEMALEYTKEKRAGKNTFKEISLYVVHGLLHLLGYDDISKADRMTMRKAEARQLKRASEIIQPSTRQIDRG